MAERWSIRRTIRRCKSCGNESLEPRPIEHAWKCIDEGRPGVPMRMVLESEAMPPVSDPETPARHVKALEPLIRNAKAKLSVLPTTGEDVQYARDDLNRALIYIASLGLNTTADEEQT